MVGKEGSLAVWLHACLHTNEGTGRCAGKEPRNDEKASAKGRVVERARERERERTRASERARGAEAGDG
jgi:hypothetical protein